MTGTQERCVCFGCGDLRPHTPNVRGGCRGCWCDLQEQARPRKRVRLRVATIPEPYKDIDELLRAAGGPAYEQMIRDARPAPAWVIDNVGELTGDLAEPEGQQEAVDTLADYLGALPALERIEYARRLAERLAVPESDLRVALNEAYRAHRPNTRFRTVPVIIEPDRPVRPAPTAEDLDV